AGYSLYYFDAPAHQIRRRDRSTNTDVGLGTVDAGLDTPAVLAMYYQSSNTNLYIAGFFTSVNGVNAVNVARCNVSTGVGTGGLDAPVVPAAIAVDIHGNIYFGTQNVDSCDHYDSQAFMKWNAPLSRWDTVGGGLEIFGNSQAGVHALAIDSNG